MAFHRDLFKEIARRLAGECLTRDPKRGTVRSIGLTMGGSKKKAVTTSADAQRLSGIRHALVALHKALVDYDRVRYEKAVGPVRSPNHFLELLTGDPWFAWLHPISQLIVSMDQALDEKEPLTAPIVEALVRQASLLLVPSETGHDFSKHYFDALQDDPDVVLAHAAATRLIRHGKARES